MLRLIDIIPRKEIDDKLNGKNSLLCELSPDFLGFEHVYAPVSIVVPKDYTIIDFGCYMAAQSYFFLNHKEYIGVDVYDCVKYNKEWDSFEPYRFITPNSKHYSCSIKTWIEEHAKTVDLDKTYAICSFVPSSQVDLVRNLFPNHTIVYCDDCEFKGIKAKEIEELYREYKALHKL